MLVQNSVQDADLSPLLLGVRRVPLGKPHLALAADQEHEIDHGYAVGEVATRPHGSAPERRRRRTGG